MPATSAAIDSHTVVTDTENSLKGTIIVASKAGETSQLNKSLP
ncbi:unnamed protein product, partial [Rotaria socialis]